MGDNLSNALSKRSINSFRSIIQILSYLLLTISFILFYFLFFNGKIKLSISIKEENLKKNERDKLQRLLIKIFKLKINVLLNTYFKFLTKD